MPDVVLPTLDEAQALPPLLAAMPDGYRPIVVDNGSTDGSGDIARDHGARVVEEPVPGFGAACFAGLLAATDDVVCFMDADGSLDPTELPLVGEPIADGSADLVLGARVLEKGSMPIHARLANRALAAEVRRRTGAPVTDIGPMRATARTALIELGMRDRRFGWPLEMVLRAAEAEWSIREVEVSYVARTGKSKVTGTVRGTARAIRDMGRLLR